jgi:hypothetical protein
MSARSTFLLLFLASTAVAEASIEIERVENNVIHFKSEAGNSGTRAPEPLAIQAHDLTPIGTIHAPTGSPYFLLAGSPCKDCVQDRSIYVVRPGVPSSQSPQSQMTFTYPGRIVDAKTGVVLVDSRAFYGKCLTGRGDVYVSFQKERIPRKRRGISTQLSVFVAEAGPDRIYEKLIDRGLPRIDQTLRMVRSKSCFEISGRHRVTKPLASFKPGSRPVEEVDDDDDDDEKKPEGTPDGESAKPPESEGKPNEGG